jgi:hypothetical protein
METTDFVKVEARSCKGCYFDGIQCHTAFLPEMIYALDKIHGNCVGNPRHIYQLAIEEVETEKMEEVSYANN